MGNKHPEPTTRPRERTLIVGVELKGQDRLLTLADSMAELSLLADTAGLEIVSQSTQRLKRPHPKTFVGAGKVEEIQALAEENAVELILFDEELSPRHQRELEKIFGENVRVLDRTALILDIFSQHAQTREGALQVELAQYEYRLPRLTRAWTHLARQAGGGSGRTGVGVGLRGPGETQLEVDQREIGRRIVHLKKAIEKVRAHRQRYRAKRRQSQIPVVALVGYTNAGKSTLLNQISDADVYVANQLFATLDPTTKRVELPDGVIALFTDTVGFIQKLPTTLVAAFRATLEEIGEADLLLHVVDVTHPNAAAQAQAVHETLEVIEADQIPIVTALNKIDRLTDPEGARRNLEAFQNSFAISALTGEGINELLETIRQRLFEAFEPITVIIPYQDGGLISLFHEHGRVDRVEHGRKGVLMEGRVPVRLVARFAPFLSSNDKHVENNQFPAGLDE
jgi:GTP-binding protein HflX